MNRVIDVECKAGEVVITNGNKVVESVKKHYGHAGKKFVEKIHEVGEDHIRKVYQTNYADLMTGDTTEKQAMAAALILTADQLADEWIFNAFNAPGLFAPDDPKILITDPGIGYRFKTTE